jgi:hypothetical protein
VLAALGATLSCSVLIDTSTKQCSADADCAKLGAAFAGSVCEKNLCVAPAPVVQDPLVCVTPDAGAGTAKLSFTIAFAATPKDPQPFDIVACDRLDVTCESPVTDHVSANAGDSVELNVPVGFQGYLQILNPSAVSAMEFLARPIFEDTAGWNLTIATETTVQQLGLATGTQIDRTLGTVIMIARDCQRAPLAGVQASIAVTQGSDTDAGPDKTVSFYFANMFPNKSLMATTTEGAAGFVNVPVGSAVLSGTIADSGFALSPTAAVSRAGWLSYVEVQP